MEKFLTPENESLMQELCARFVDARNNGERCEDATWNAILKLGVMCSFEAVILRFKAYHVPKIFLTRRPDSDPYYAGLWHCPGTYMLPGENEQSVAARLSLSELGEAKIVEAQDQGSIIVTDERSTTNSKVYLCRLDKKPTVQGEWFLINALPNNLVRHHRTVIYMGLPLEYKALLAK